MPVCARAVQGQDGTLFLALDPTATDLAACQYVVEDGATNSWRELASLSVEDAHAIGLAVCLVWAVAWGFKVLARAVDTSSNNES